MRRADQRRAFQDCLVVQPVCRLFEVRPAMMLETPTSRRLEPLQEVLGRALAPAPRKGASRRR